MLTRATREPTRIHFLPMRSLAVAATLLGLIPTAWAARPFVTDDARIVDHGACQVEIWTQQGPDGGQYWGLPACNPTGNFELTLGTGVLPADSGGNALAAAIQGKTLFRPLTPGGVGVGVAAGAVMNSGALDEDTLLGNAYAYVPVSVQTAGEALTAHVNLGVRYNGDPGVVSLLWGLAAELQLLTPLYAIGEVYGGNAADDQFTQMGARLWVVPDHFQMDATYGRQLGASRDQEWFTIGVRVLTSPFFFLGGGS